MTRSVYFLEGLSGYDCVAEPRCRKAIAKSLQHIWPKEFMEADMRLLIGDTSRFTDLQYLTLAASQCEYDNVRNEPHRISGSGSSYSAGKLPHRINVKAIDHVPGAPFHSQAQSQNEHGHQTRKYCVSLESYFLPGELERQIDIFTWYKSASNTMKRLIMPHQLTPTLAGLPLSSSEVKGSNDKH